MWATCLAGRRGAYEWRLVGRVDKGWGPDIKSLLLGEWPFLGCDGQQAVAEACASMFSAGGCVLCFWLLLGLFCTLVLKPCHVPVWSKS